MDNVFQEIEWLASDNPLIENGVILQERHGSDTWSVVESRTVIDLKPTRYGVKIVRVRGGRKQLLGRPTRILTYFELARDYVISKEQFDLLRLRHESFKPATMPEPTQRNLKCKI